MTVEEWEEEQEPVEVWPEHEQAYRLFVGLRTQWRVGFSGPTGLDYGVLYRDLDRLNLTPEQYEELRQEIRVMESAALDEMHRED